MSKLSVPLGRRLFASVFEPSSPAPCFHSPARLAVAGFRACQATNHTPKYSSRRPIHTERPSAQSSGPNGAYTKRSFTSSGLLLVGLTTNASTSVPPGAVATPGNVVSEAPSTGLSRNAQFQQLARLAWRRSLYTDARRGARVEGKRYSSSKSDSKDVDSKKSGASQPLKHDTPKPPDPNKPVNPEHHHDDPESIATTMSKYLHMPKMPHRPTREELLAAANGFWERFGVRFKWASIRSMRPWNIDEWGAFVSWFLFGHLVWILVGTTTFVSLCILSINTVVAQETLARWVGDSLTESAGVTVVFESAIVPKWNDGVISFRNVFVSRRPGQIKSSVSKGSSTSAAAVAAAGRQHEHDAEATPEDDGNYTQFDVTIANVNVTLSFLKWWNGKGFLQDVEVKGVRGVVDRTSVHWSDEPVDPLSYRHEHQPGDFEIDSFKLEDVLVTVHQPGGFRPFSVSIFSAELPQLRKRWLFYDFLSATHMSGSYDGSLFTIHPRQVHGAMAGDNRDLVESLGDENVWKKFSRLRIDGMKLDHLNRGVDGPFGWIYEGNVDIVADVMFPVDADEGITKVMSDFYDQLEEIVISNRLRLLQKDIASDPLTPADSQNSTGSWFNMATTNSSTPGDQSSANAGDAEEDDRRYLIMDLRIHMNDVKAAVPLFTNQMSYINQALVRPIVAYINAKKTYIPISCRIVKRASDFDGSWTVFDCGLMDDLSAETYEAFARDVENQQSRVRRFRKVGFWTLSLAVHALFMGMAGNVV